MLEAYPIIYKLPEYRTAFVGLLLVKKFILYTLVLPEAISNWISLVVPASSIILIILLAS